MPGGDRTGPAGMGPMSGRGFGMMFGRGRVYWGRGFRGGGGWRHRFFATGLPGWMRFGRFGPGSPHPDPEREKRELGNLAETLESELDAVKKRIREIETGSAEK